MRSSAAASAPDVAAGAYIADTSHVAAELDAAGEKSVVRHADVAAAGLALLAEHDGQAQADGAVVVAARVVIQADGALAVLAESDGAQLVEKVPIVREPQPVLVRRGMTAGTSSLTRLAAHFAPRCTATAFVGCAAPRAFP